MYFYHIQVLGEGLSVTNHHMMELDFSNLM